MPQKSLFLGTPITSVFTDSIPCSAEKKTSSQCKEYKHIYANAGTWKDGKTCTFIEVEDNGSEGSYYVRGYSFEDAQHQTLREEGCIRIET